MSSLKYSVEIEYFTRGLDPSATKVFDKVGKGSDKWMQKLGSDIAGLSGAFNSMFDRAAGAMVSTFASASQAVGAALAGGMAFAVHQAFKFNEEMENATIAMGTIFGANGVGAKKGIDPLVTGMRLAQISVSEMRKDARELPGEFKDLQRIMTTIAAPGAQAGLDATGIEKLASKSMVAGAVLGVHQDVVAREMAMILAGTARHSMPLFNRLGLGDAKSFNKLDAFARFQRVSGKLDDIYKSKDMISGTWDALFPNLKDVFRQSAGAVGNPLFEAVKGKMKYALGVGVDPASAEGRSRQGQIDKLTDFGMKAGDFLAHSFERAFEVGERAIAQWYGPIKNFITVMHDGLRMVFARIKPYVTGLGIRDMLGNFKISDFDRIAKVASSLAALRVASGGLSGFGSNIGGIGGLMSAGSSMGMGAAEMAAVVPVIGVALAGLATAIYGVTHAALDASSMFHGLVSDELRYTGENLKEMGKSLVHIGSMLTPVADALGTTMLTSIQGATVALRSLTSVVEWMISGWTGMFYSVTHGGKNQLNDPDDLAMRKQLSEAADDRRNDLFSSRYSSNKELNPEGVDLNMKAPNITNHNNYQIKIEVNGTEDPDRVAKTVWTEIQNRSRYPTSSSSDTGQRIRDARSY